MWSMRPHFKQISSNSNEINLVPTKIVDNVETSATNLNLTQPIPSNHTKANDALLSNSSNKLTNQSTSIAHQMQPKM